MHAIFFPIFVKIEKRIRMIIATGVITSIMFICTFLFFDKSIVILPILVVFTLFFTYFSLLEGIEKVEWFTLFIMPVLTVIALYFFYFLFPVRWLTRLPFLIFFGISVYANLLVSNIFNVGVEKSLQLYRAAFSVNYFYQTLLLFIVSNLIFSLKLSFFENGLLFFGVVSVLAIQLIWSIKLDQYIEKRVLYFGLLISWIITQVSVLISFIPLQSPISALALSSGYYIVGGLVYLHIDSRLFKETIREYLFVLGFIICVVFLSISW
ncbi:hypothetical protein COY87_03540 [Candidatus Roizmanbacteria bacterium CG_4_10_14_0_8_um_filter_33_9]|uniref:Uncharacterized protein n=1 Tax=Candidatus Roizmanbacteria bacterium CG_4_10_14_0_8_um_filter_33_9 TaxID=1974826 RepID=A0A2M7QJA1_9BACT|nr:MAG: hypothetical protein COY87_03540 [Candidatus Roizmanbacteria bacterium CG_4_10_14_0_8_um_filter_33_9]